MSNDSNLLTIRAIAQRLGISRVSAWKKAVTGELPAVMITQGARRRTFRVKPEVLDAWIKSREVGDASRL